MNRTITAAALLAVAAVALPSQSFAQERAADADFTWSGKVPRGGWIRVHTVKGNVRVEPGTGESIEIRGVKRDKWGGEEDIAFEVVKDGQNVTICALYEDRGECDADGLRNNSGRRGWNSRGNDPSANFTVKLPKGVNIAAMSGNGEVDVTDAGADVEARSGNGRVSVSRAVGAVKASSGNGIVTVDDAGGPVIATSGNGRVRVNTAAGPVTASSGNGDIDVRMNVLQGDDDMEFRTGNGTVTVSVPNGFEGEIDGSTGNGKFLTDFPITVSGRLDSRHVRGTIGKGGRKVRMSSGNGNLELRKM